MPRKKSNTSHGAIANITDSPPSMSSHSVCDSDNSMMGTDIMESLKSMQKSMDNMNHSLIMLTNEVAQIRTEIDDYKGLKASVELAHSDISDLRADVENLKVKTKDNETSHDLIMMKLNEAKNENKILNEQLLHLDWYIRRENLKIRGIPGDEDEPISVTVRKVRDLLIDKLGIENGRDIVFHRCHRLRRNSRIGNADIIVRFAWYGDRERVFNKRFSLKGTDIYINEDFPPEIEKHRSRLYPIYKTAKGKNMKPKLYKDKLIINRATYTVDSLHALPLELRPETLATCNLDTAVLFYGQDSYLSNFYPSKFMLDGKIFDGSEQYYQYKKALHAGNQDLAEQILNNTPTKLPSFKLFNHLSVRFVRHVLHEWFLRNPDW